MSIPTIHKDPNAELNYGRDWASWLGAGEVISTSTWIVPAGLTVVGSLDGHDDTKTVVKLSGGTVGETYRVTNRITTSLAQTDDRSFNLYMTER